MDANRLAALAFESQVGMFITDSHEVILRANRAFTEITGYTENEARGHTPRLLSSGHQDAGFYEAMHQTLKQGGAWQGEIWNRRKNGEVFPEWLTITAIKDDSGNTTHFVATLADITSRRQAREILKASEEKYRALIETTGTGYLIVDGAGKVVDANPEYARLAGHCALSDILGKSVTRWTASHDRERSARAMAQCVSDGFIRNLEIDYEDASGRITPIEVNATVIGAGESIRIIALCRDISDRKADQTALISSRDEAVVLLEQVSRVESSLRALNDTLEERVARRTVALEAANNTLLKAQDELAKSEANAMLATLVAGVSHELSTPLGNALITASTLVELSEAFRRSVQANQIRRSDLAALVNSMQSGSALVLRNLQRAGDLLENFRQVVNDQASEKRRTFDLAKHVQEIVATLAPSFKHKPHRVVVDIAPGILMDSMPGALGQVIINLVNNAYLHAFEGRSEGVLVIGAQVTVDQVELQIKDNGVGMLSDQVARLFEPFFTTKQGRGGTGLGMSIVSCLVSKNLGGNIAVRTEAGIGTQFDVRLPLRAPEDHGQV